MLVKIVLMKKKISESYSLHHSLSLTVLLSFCTPDIVLYLCENEHIEGGMIFQLLEDLTEMSTMRNCKDVFGYIESKQDILGKVCVFKMSKDLYSLFFFSFWFCI